MRRSRWYHRRDWRFIFFVAFVLIVYEGQGRVLGPSRITDELDAALDGGERVNILITTRFPAEAFHFGIFQDLGVIWGSKDNETTIYAVEPNNIRMLSRKYWVEIIAVAPAD